MNADKGTQMNADALLQNTNAYRRLSALDRRSSAFPKIFHHLTR